MSDPRFTLVAAIRAEQTTDMLHRVAAATDSHVVEVETAVSHNILQLPLLQHLTEVIPAADLLVGAPC
jgi:hypothetical protein